MSYPALATVDDVTARMFRDLTEAELARVDMMLVDVSAVIRNYTRQPFTTQRTTQKLRPQGFRLRLPRRPVVEIHSVAVITGGDPVTVAGYTWDGGDEIWLPDASTVINLSEAAAAWSAENTPLAEVDYTSGYDETPDDVKSVACSMITRALSQPGAGGIISEAVGEYQYRLSDAAAQGPLTLTPSERSILAPYRRSAVAVELRG